MSNTKIEIEAEGLVYEIDFWGLAKTLQSKQISAGLTGNSPVYFDESCAIRVNGSEWHKLTDDLCNAIIAANGDIIEVLKYYSPELALNYEEEIRRQQEAEAQQQQEAEAIALQKIHQLKAKCASGEWSLDDFQYIFHLVSQILPMPPALTDKGALLQARCELINQVMKNPSLTEAIKLMYAKTQLELQQQVAKSQQEMQQQILAILEQLSSKQAQSNANLIQNQKSRNLMGAAGMLGATRVLSELGDISDSLGGDE